MEKTAGFALALTRIIIAGSNEVLAAYMSRKSLETFIHRKQSLPFQVKICLKGEEEEEALLRLDSSPLAFQELMCLNMAVSGSPAGEEFIPGSSLCYVWTRRSREETEGEEEARPLAEITD
ncbi:hypothetical protein CDL15_Pgr002741 [Punica granatum]|uniref:Uncharacterized protein n=1 Tax=Punica granatum TaxID=22663 RepID=A0A218X0S3_PUNGR|nr:hypothetical protein CDL15_Pgr002741 [Punica granatum]